MGTVFLAAVAGSHLFVLVLVLLVAAAVLVE